MINLARYCQLFRADLGELKYLTMCIRESMRFHGTVPFIQRELKSEVTIDGVALPPKSIVNINLYNVHHNPTVWEDHMVSRARFCEVDAA